ncbi:MAG: hypothetical protein AAF352_00070 [Pseudomonadota bacterium]
MRAYRLEICAAFLGLVVFALPAMAETCAIRTQLRAAATQAIMGEAPFGRGHARLHVSHFDEAIAQAKARASDNKIHTAFSKIATMVRFLRSWSQYGETRAWVSGPENVAVAVPIHEPAPFLTPLRWEDGKWVPYDATHVIIVWDKHNGRCRLITMYPTRDPDPKRAFLARWQ